MITLSKLAKMANVSVSTASKAFYMSHEVSEETRNHIFEIAKSEGVFKKFYNAKYPKLVIAIICPEFEGRYYASLITSLRHELDALGCEVLVSVSNFSKDTGNELLEYYSNYTNVDGIIVLDSSLDISLGEIPTVYMSASKLEQMQTCHSHQRAIITCSQSEAISEGIKYFKSLGIFDVGYIGEPHSVIRFKKFISAMSEAGLTPNNSYIIDDAERFEEGGYKAMMHLIDRDTVPRAIFCSYDHIAIGAMRAIYERGLSVPRDVRLFSVDNVTEGKYITPSLSSIDTKSLERCAAAAKALVNMILGKPFVQLQNFTSELIKRESMG